MVIPWKSIGRTPCARFDTVHQAIDRLTDGEIKHLAIQRRVIAGCATKTDHLTIGQRVFASPRGREDDL